MGNWGYSLQEVNGCAYRVYRAEKGDLRGMCLQPRPLHALAMQGKNQAVNKLVSVFIPAALGVTAIAMLVDGCHKIYTGKGKLE